MNSRKVLSSFNSSTPKRFLDAKFCKKDLSCTGVSIPGSFSEDFTIDKQHDKSRGINEYLDQDSEELFLEDTLLFSQTQIENIQERRLCNNTQDAISANRFCETPKTRYGSPILTEIRNLDPCLFDTFLEESREKTSDLCKETKFDDQTEFVDILQESVSHINDDEIIIPSQFDSTYDSFQNQLCSENIFDEDDNNYYGLPKEAKYLFTTFKNVDKLYEENRRLNVMKTHIFDWQNECLNLPALKHRRNLIYALPTSGGKTLVAEILMLQEVLCRKKNVIFILPFVALVQEKVWSLSPFAVHLNFLIEEYAAGKGTIPPRKRRKKNCIYIATIEKALALVRSLVEANRLDELGLVVVDELHLVGEPSRGSTLEILLSTLRYSTKNVQIIGMSATIGNIDELAKFLDAEVYMNDFRPVELKEYIKVGELIYSVNTSSDGNLSLTPEDFITYEYSPQVESLDPDHIGGLVMDVIPKGSCLIFCPTKKNCENVAVLLCKVIFKQLLEYKAEEKKALLEALRTDLGNSVCPILSNTIPWGVAYHHSGLTSEERKLLEENFRSGVLSVLCCTSTLAAGVNLPAQRVILRSPFVGRSFITLSTYKQMVGRAGRAGYGAFGESVLICPKDRFQQVKELLDQPMDKATSNLHENNALALRGFILSAIALNMATNISSLKCLVKSTLLGVQAERLEVSLNILVSDCLRELLRGEAIEILNTKRKRTLSEALEDSNSEYSKILVSQDSEFKVSKLGLAAIKGCMDLKVAKLLYSDMQTAQMSVVLLGVMHLLYLVTPYEYMDIRPNMNTYYEVFSRLDAEGKQTAKVLGITESNAVRMMTGKSLANVPERVVVRFYVTLILYELWNQTPIAKVAEKYHVTRGTVQSMMVTTASFACNVLRFCEQIEELWPFKELLANFTTRIAHCCSAELLPLMELPNVKKARAMQLFRAGYKKIENIAKANANDLVESVEHMPLKVAKKLISSAKMLLMEKIENLREEAEDVLEELRV